ncbi:hypothetical protein Lbir_2075 [Legionella birminghamensis]|uniref:Alpha/beta hydrolase n=1 Tax=Legionella birminghamensis TaxID=28083 RepID=A0A378I8Y1_9GAMM|nr:alpha/beta fold hydrolase [Legionella birminghamensis]KTC69336.1 hypothetical protein Lbir_2075 [Legionella birminghamensis]STX31599.1 alpha/beta hydrolase [Legionella birminghamensis]
MVRYCLFITLVLFYFPLEAEQMQAQANELQKSHFLKIEHFRLTSGKTLRNLKLHYLTLGKPKYNERHEITNAIMLFHATINDSSSFLQSSLAPFLFNKGAPFDAQKYYIIIPDGIGAGQSSKPSDGLYGQFPVYGYKDQIAASKAVLDSLGVNHLKLVLGTSMGGMLTWLWGETYPDSTDVLIPIVSTPLQVCGRNFIWREMMLAAIRNDPLWLWKL